MNHSWIYETLKALRLALLAVGFALFIIFGSRAMGQASSRQQVAGRPHLMPFSLQHGATGSLSGVSASAAFFLAPVSVTPNTSVSSSPAVKPTTAHTSARSVKSTPPAAPPVSPSPLSHHHVPPMPHVSAHEMPPQAALHPER